MRTLPVVSNRARICLSCREKTCCSYYTVTVTTHDLLRIARTMQLMPSEFLTYQRTSDDDKGGFLLQRGGARHAMALAKRPASDDTSSPCVFLLRTNDQHGLCSLGDLASGTMPDVSLLSRERDRRRGPQTGRVRANLVVPATSTWTTSGAG